MRSFRIAVIPGDGIGIEVVPEGLRVLEKAAVTSNVREIFTYFTERKGKRELPLR